MLELNRWETKQVMSGRATGIVRKYDGGCPHSPGGELILTSKYLDSKSRNIPFAKAQVVTVRPGTVGQFRRDPMIAEMDGYANGEVWFGQMGVMYRGIKNEEQVYHIKFRITEIDKQAGSK
jgi:hypothetical protein